jgi:hypothetical protein
MSFGHADGREYEVLVEATKKVVNVEGFSCEIGLREGGGSLRMIDALKSTGQERTHIAIDPYGNIPYFMHEHQCLNAGYCNGMRDDVIHQMFEYCKNKKQDFLFFQLESKEFFKRFNDGVPVYNTGKKVVTNKYAIVYLDGNHKSTEVMPEILFFAERMDPGAILVVDDTDFFDFYEAVNPMMTRLGFESLIKGEVKHAFKKL